MKSETSKKVFNKRAFISVAMFVSLSILPLSGLMNHVYQFDLLIKGRHFWMTVHNISSIIFLIFGVIHLVYNRRSFTNYIKKSKDTLLSKESVIAFLLVIVIIFLFTSHVFHI